MEFENLLPSGEQIELRQGDRSAVVTSVGATLRSFQTAGVDVVDGFPVSAMASGGRGQVLCPWPNRVAGGRYTFAGVSPGTYFVLIRDDNFRLGGALYGKVISSDPAPANNDVDDDNNGTSAIWTVSTASDQTNYAGSDNVAAVQATSSQPGKATLALSVTFITNTYSTLLQGDYQIDVVGTIAAN